MTREEVKETKLSNYEAPKVDDHGILSCLLCPNFTSFEKAQIEDHCEKSHLYCMKCYLRFKTKSDIRQHFMKIHEQTCTNFNYENIEEIIKVENDPLE